MNPTTVTAVVGAATALVALAVGVLNLIAGRSGRRADAAKTITDTGLELLAEVNKKCDKCESELATVKKTLRAVVRSLDSNDPTAVAAATASARDLI